MLLPSTLATMRLGSRWDRAAASPIVAGAAQPKLPGAYGRVSACPRVSGNNQTLGDCVETAAANAAQTAMARKSVYGAISNAYVVGLYSAIAGYRPGDPASDQGTDPNALLAYWQTMPIAGYRLAGAARLDPQAEPELRTAIIRSGGVMLIVALSVEQQNQRVWMPVGTPGSWGEHAVWCDSFDGGLSFATSWGEDMPIDRSYFEAPGFVLGAYSFDLVAA